MWTCLKFAIHEITKVWFFLNFFRHFCEKTIILILVLLIFLVWRGLARTQVPTTRNCTVELLAFGVIAGVSPSEVQCKSLALEEAPWWSGLLPRQVSMSWVVLSLESYEHLVYCLWLQVQIAFFSRELRKNPAINTFTYFHTIFSHKISNKIFQLNFYIFSRNFCCYSLLFPF